MDLRPRELLERRVVVALVRAPGDPHHGARHALQRIVDRIDVRCLRVVDPQHTAALGDGFEAVLHRGEVVERAAHRFGVDTRGKGRQRRGHGVVGVVQPPDLQLRRVDLDRAVAHGCREAPVQQEGVARGTRHGVLCREGQLPRPQVVFGQLAPDHLVVARVDEPVARGLVLRDAHLGIDVVLEAVVVAVQVVGRDVHQHADVGPEAVHAVELERAQLEHVPVVVARGDAVGEALADVAAQGDVHPGVAHDLVDERRRGSLAVRAGDADAARTAHVAARELHLGDHRNAPLADAPHDGRRVGNAGRLDDLRGLQDALLAVAALLIGDLPLVEARAKALGNVSRIGEQDVETPLFGEDRGAVAADSPAQYDDLFHTCISFIGSSA